ncbi:MurR/RpiR family transcriptional regulator [Geobacillus vulcani]|uniref:MurR/RpiR family transcriptional regulator n=1 Tax=Geobacillus vulcani TaxID=135517 RepID=UPI0004DF9C33|nr:MurR/RpiR family transcriptional regulator [Geobacillus vulcani]
MSNVYQLIASKIPQMSKSQVKIAKYILEHPNEVPFFTVGKLAEKTGVSEATIVRFANFLGYSGYPELQQYMQHSVQKQLTTVERLQMSHHVYEHEKGIYDIFHDDIHNIKSTMERLDVNAFKQAVHSILKAERTYIVANRSATSLGIFLHYYLQIILNDVYLMNSIEAGAEKIYDINEKDVMIGISFSRYTNSTIKMLSYGKKQGATIIAITDHLLSPLVPYSDIVLTASSQMPTFIDSFVAPLSLINALITFIGKEKGNDVQRKLEELETIWDHFGVFYK